MICLRCGYCCINYDVIIVSDSEKGIVETNLVHKPSGVVCPHLGGSVPGEYCCRIHSKSWFARTPCGNFSQVEATVSDNCRVGKYIISKGGNI